MRTEENGGYDGMTGTKRPAVDVARCAPSGVDDEKRCNRACATTQKIVEDDNATKCRISLLQFHRARRSDGKASGRKGFAHTRRRRNQRRKTFKEGDAFEEPRGFKRTKRDNSSNELHAWQMCQQQG